MEQKRNRPGRLPHYDYGSVGYYFITFCTKGRAYTLSHVLMQRSSLTCVGRDDPGAPNPPPATVALTTHGTTLDHLIRSIPSAYHNVTVHKYAIMPNHVHLLLSIDQPDPGAPGSSRPTQLLPRIVAYLKRVTNRAAGYDLWQTTYHDHIIRNEADYLQIWNYIDTNPAKWQEDCYYKEGA